MAIELVTVDVEPPRRGEVRLRVIATAVYVNAYLHTSWLECECGCGCSQFPADGSVGEGLPPPACKHQWEIQRSNTWAQTSSCHTDAYTLSGADAEGVFPCILGHEGGAIVESVGDGVESLSPGDHVVPLYIPECRKCKFCVSKRTNLCSVVRATQGRGLMPDGTTRFSVNGRKVFHYMGCSTFSEYTVCLEISCARVSSRAPLSRICLLGCGITTGYMAARRNIQSVTNYALNEAPCIAGTSVASCCSSDDVTVAVFGLGAVGLSAVQGARSAGAKRIFAIDVNPLRETLARTLGATDFINPHQIGDGSTGALVEYLIGITDGGVDYSFECVGDVGLMRAALECCHKGWGTSIIIGVAAAGKEIATRPFQLVTGRTWKGSAFGGCKGRSELPGLVESYLAGELKVDEFVTQELKFEEINSALGLMKAGQSIRTVLLY